MTNATGRYRLPVGIRIVDVDRSGHWLAAGWRDFLATPRVSLMYGGAFAVVSALLGVGLIATGLGSLVLPLVGGFVMLAPILVVGLYDVSRRLERGGEIALRHVVGAFRDNIGQLSAMGVVLLIVWFVWVEIAIFLFAIFFHQAPPPLHTFVEDVLFSLQSVPFLLIGTIFGAAFAAVVFTITAVSIPLLMDRPVDVITAIAASILAVRANWRVMFGWAAMIAVFTAGGVALFFVGLAVALPVLAYATWHAYRDLLTPELPPLSGEGDLGAGAGI
ncbi:MAG: DUF2189 domain-containing protein [Rhodospirillales bacterium]